MLVIRASERLGPGELAYVDPDAELIFVRPGLSHTVEQEVLRQATAGMLGRWDQAPDTAAPSHSRWFRPALRVLPGGNETDEVG